MSTSDMSTRGSSWKQSGHHLFTFGYDFDSRPEKAKDGDSGSSSLQLRMNLEKCTHGRLSQDSDTPASLLVFSLHITSQRQDAERFLKSMNIRLGFSREIPHDDDQIEILQTGEDVAMAVGLHSMNRLAAWSVEVPSSHLRFGVLLKRNFNDIFVASFSIKLLWDVSAVKGMVGGRDEPELVLFDPSAAPVGKILDGEALETSGHTILWSLSTFDDIEGANQIAAARSTSANEAPLKTSSSAKALPPTDNTPTVSKNNKQHKVVQGFRYHQKQRLLEQQAQVQNEECIPGNSEAHHPQPSQGQSISTNQTTWSDPARYITSHEVGIKLFGLHVTRTGVRCIRSVKLKATKTLPTGETKEYHSSGHWHLVGMLIHRKEYHDEFKAHEESQARYVVVGQMSTAGFCIREHLFLYQAGDDEEMLKKLRRSVRVVRGSRGLLSLKKVSGFGLYECSPSHGHHIRSILSPTQRSCMRHLYNSYDIHSREFRWDDWIHKNLNNSSGVPASGRYSIEILLSWSVLRLSIVTSIPVLLSLAVGFWYQTLPVEDGSDPTGTAWIIATYIITAGALIIAFLGVATGLEQS